MPKSKFCCCDCRDLPPDPRMIGKCLEMTISGCPQLDGTYRCQTRQFLPPAEGCYTQIAYGACWTVCQMDMSAAAMSNPPQFTVAIGAPMRTSFLHGSSFPVQNDTPSIEVHTWEPFGMSVLVRFVTLGREAIVDYFALLRGEEITLTGGTAEPASSFPCAIEDVTITIRLIDCGECPPPPEPPTPTDCDCLDFDDRIWLRLVGFGGGVAEANDLCGQCGFNLTRVHERTFFEANNLFDLYRTGQFGHSTTGGWRWDSGWDSAAQESGHALQLEHWQEIIHFDGACTQPQQGFEFYLYLRAIVVEMTCDPATGKFDRAANFQPIFGTRSRTMTGGVWGEWVWADDGGAAVGQGTGPLGLSVCATLDDNRGDVCDGIAELNVAPVEFLREAPCHRDFYCPPNPVATALILIATRRELLED